MVLTQQSRYTATVIGSLLVCSCMPRLIPSVPDVHRSLVPCDSVATSLQGVHHQQVHPVSLHLQEERLGLFYRSSSLPNPSRPWLKSRWGKSLQASILLRPPLLRSSLKWGTKVPWHRTGPESRRRQPTLPSLSPSWRSCQGNIHHHLQVMSLPPILTTLLSRMMPYILTTDQPRMLSHYDMERK